MVRKKFAIAGCQILFFSLWIGCPRLFWKWMNSPAKPGARTSQSFGAAGEQVATMGHLSEFTDKQSAFAVRIPDSLITDGFPADSAWLNAPPLRFSADWQGQNADPQRETEVRLLWTSNSLFLQFRARYRTITVFPDSDPNGRRDHLWDRDVVEVFLQPDFSDPRRYKEFEVSPNGFWIDLDIAPGEKHNPQSGLHRRVSIDEQNKRWVAELAIPLKSLAAHVDPLTVWRVNFFRVEGPTEPRFYSAWQPTNTPQPNFHVPEAFGQLIFSPVVANL
jgi:alpha-galactosidase